MQEMMTMIKAGKAILWSTYTLPENNGVFSSRQQTPQHKSSLPRSSQAEKGKEDYKVQSEPSERLR